MKVKSVSKISENLCDEKKVTTSKFVQFALLDFERVKITAVLLSAELIENSCLLLLNIPRLPFFCRETTRFTKKRDKTRLFKGSNHPPLANTKVLGDIAKKNCINYFLFIFLNPRVLLICILLTNVDKYTSW